MVGEEVGKKRNKGGKIYDSNHKMPYTLNDASLDKREIHHIRSFFFFLLPNPNIFLTIEAIPLVITDSRNQCPDFCKKKKELCKTEHEYRSKQKKRKDTYFAIKSYSKFLTLL